jgi:hypothetical protein
MRRAAGPTPNSRLISPRPIEVVKPPTLDDILYQTLWVESRPMDIQKFLQLFDGGPSGAEAEDGHFVIV